MGRNLLQFGDVIYRNAWEGISIHLLHLRISRLINFINNNNNNNNNIKA